MKTYTTKLLNKECILVEMPKDAKGYNFARKSYYTGKNSDSNKFQLITGDETIEFENVELINLLSELTDDDVEDLVEKWKSVANDGTIIFENYKEGIPKKRTPLESFFSALEAEGLFLNGNPYLKKTFEIDLIELTTDDVDKFERWHEAETRTFDKTRTILLIKN